MTPEFRKPANDASESGPARPEPVAAPTTVPTAPPVTPPVTEPEPSGPEQWPEPLEPIRRTRTGVLWMSMVLAAVVLILLLVFIIQNSAKVDISFMGAHGHLPLGVALLLAAVSGLLLVAIPGTGRIVQLRRQVRRGQRTLRAGARPSEEQLPEPRHPADPHQAG
ncbi:DUF1049 domain-containing protein [Streptacidiphilus sp. PB12-B1b]|uniref:LapA family protein n=1 Tax=Streptacidiphilus sp. PB12-B1b TaxID=2705012 RepID=UPI0015FD75C6|nr:LapA family protein [Streptacidiphilus sp. PB12-B1b]QMU75771.1 DUF1049 domain-containing protein [Streptacidiphilus sp. PB12-B1b]